jgi:hypothetical protein
MDILYWGLVKPDDVGNRLGSSSFSQFGINWSKNGSSPRWLADQVPPINIS